MVEIIPAIIPESLEDLKTKLEKLRGVASLVQIDVTDGMFVLSRSWPLRAGDDASFKPLLRGKAKLPYADEFRFEVDLMTHSPEEKLAQWVKLGLARAVFHLESKHNFSELKRIAGDTIELGIAIDLDPPYQRLASYIHDVDYVQVMGIGKLGKQGEPFDLRAIALVEKVRIDFPNVTIQVDGGVGGSDVARLVEAGATRLVSGSYILSAADPANAIQTLKDHANPPH